MRKFPVYLSISIFVLLITLIEGGTYSDFNLSDRTPDSPLSPPDQTSIEPRYVSGIGTDSNFTVFFEDRNNSNVICYVHTEKGPTHFENNVTETNVTDYHFLVKDWPITINGTAYGYRAWGMHGNDPYQTFYVSNDLIHWNLISVFTIPNDPAFTNARGGAYYGFHDVIAINGRYYAFGESNQGQTMLLRSEKGDDNWTAIASIGGTQSGDGPLEVPDGVTAGWTPRGSFFDLGGDQGLGKIYNDPRDSHLYLAVNTAAKSSLSPQDYENAFLNTSNWTWHDDSTGKAAAPIFSGTSKHDIRESWLVPRSSEARKWILIYDADYGGSDGKALGYATVLPEPCAGAVTTLNDHRWKLIGIPCETGSNDIETLFGGSEGLGDYETDWVMYEQSGSDNYEVNASHPSTDKRRMLGSDTVTPGKGYWIIADLGGSGHEKNLTIPTSLSDLHLSPTVDTSSVGISDPDFTEVHLSTLPKGGDLNDVNYMSGNPFALAFPLSKLNFKHNGTGSGYHPMGSSANDTYINRIVYRYADDGSGYTAVDPSTPGFNGSISVMEGFFIRIKADSNDDDNNSFAYPLME